jgi:hypothetical protein
VLAAIETAGDLRCSTVRLESLPGLMDDAIALYRRLGFRPTERFDDDTNLDGMVYLEHPARPPARSTYHENGDWPCVSCSPASPS